MRAILILSFLLSASMSLAQKADPYMTTREGWVVMPTDKPFDRLVGDVKSAVKANKMGVVTQAGPTGAAKSRGITIPGNRVIGVFNNVYAVRILALSTAAMIEAPIRIYITENPDGTATLSYKTPTYVFTPYVAEAGVGLADAASELDAVFAKIAASASR